MDETERLVALRRARQKAQRELPRLLGKKSRNDNSHYNYVGIDQITAEAGQVLTDNGLFLSPSYVSGPVREQLKSGGHIFIWTYSVTLSHVDGGEESWMQTASTTVTDKCSFISGTAVMREAIKWALNIQGSDNRQEVERLTRNLDPEHNEQDRNEQAEDEAAAAAVSAEIDSAMGAGELEELARKLEGMGLAGPIKRKLWGEWGEQCASLELDPRKTRAVALGAQ